MTITKPMVFVCLVATAILSLSLNTSADEPPFSTRKVLDSNTANWPRGPWKPIKRSSFQAMIDSIARQSQQPRAAWIERAQYSARLEQTQLRDGTLSFELINSTSLPLAVSLSPLRIALGRLTLDGQPATWGTTSQGHAVIVAPPGRHTVSGNWNLAGHNVASLLEFQLHLASATLTTLKLDLPRQQHLEVSHGELSGPQNSSDPTRRAWQLALGRRTDCRLLVSRAGTTAPDSKRLLVRRRTACVLEPAGAQLVTTLEIENRGRPTNRVTLSFPRRVLIESVLYDGLPINAQPRQAGDRLACDVQLPDPLTGPGRVLQVTGTTAVPLETEWELPVVKVEGGQLIPRAPDSSQPDLSLDVKPPLELKSFQAQGLRQTADAVGGRQFTFTRFRADARLRLRAGHPARSLSASVLTGLSRQPVGWKSTVEIAWSANSGNAFLSRCLLAPHWKLVDLKPATNTSRLEWRTVIRNDGRQLLVVEWPDAIDSETPQRVLLQLSRSAGNLTTTDFPLVEPLECEQHDQILAFAGRLKNERLLSRQGGPLEPVTAKTFIDDWSGFSTLEPTVSSATGGLFRWRRPADPAGVDPERSLEPPEAPGLTVNTSPPSEPLSQPLPDAPRGRVTALSLQSRLGPAGALEDQHVAIVTFDGGDFREPFQFTLPAPGQLDFVLINGQPVRPEIQDSRISIPPLEQGTFRSIELRYHSPAHTGFLVANRQIPIPQLDDSVAFGWALVIPPDLHASDSLGSSGAGARTSWTQRFLGPLGRSDHQSIFNPLSAETWHRVFDSFRPGGPLKTTAETLRKGMDDTPPKQLEVSCIRRGRLAGISWSLLLGCLLGGLVLRRRQSANYPWFAGIWLAMLTVLSWWIPTPWTVPVGGCLAGSLLGMIIPMALLSRPHQTEWLSPPKVPLESTRTFHQIPTGLSLLLVGGLFAAVLAQDPSSPTTGPPEPQVLLPVDPQGKPSTQVPFVFVRPELLESLENSLASSQEVPDTLISSVVYTSRIDRNQAVELKARFEVQVPEKKRTVTVRLPINGANLGPDSCRVNGRRHPLARSQDGSQLLLELPPSATQSNPDKSDPDKSDPGVPESRPRIDIVELDLRPNVQLSGNGGTFHVLVPSINNSRLNVSVADSATRLQVSSCLGVQAGQPDVPRSFDLGPVDRLDLAWSGPDGLSTPQTQATCQPLCLANIHPLATRFHYRLPVEITTGAIPFVIVSLPGDLVIRPDDVQANDLLALRRLPRKGPRQELIVEFSKPQTEDFVIELVGQRAHLVTEDDQITLDSTIGLSHGTPTTPLPMEPLWLGVVASRGFQVETTGKPLPDGIRSEDVAELAKRWTSTETAVPMINVAWSLSRTQTIPIRIHPVQPLREVKLEHFFHVRPDRIELTVIAAVKTRNTSVFQHVLRVDPAIRITSVSIQEQDGAERMARRARIKDRLILFLKDQNLFREETQTGRQRITVHANLPLAIPRNFELPRITLEDAQVTDSVLSLYHHPRLAVALQGAEALSTVETATETGRDNEVQEVHFGRFRLSPDPLEKPNNVTLHVQHQQLPAALNVAYRLRLEDSSRWKLLMSTEPVRELNSKGPLQLQISPDLLAADKQVPEMTIVPTPDKETKNDNGRLEADFLSADKTQLTAILPPPPDNGPWIPPLPQVDRRTISTRVILLDTSAAWTLTGEVSQLDALPEWIKLGTTEANDTLVFRIEGDNWSLIRELTSASTPAAKPPTTTPAPVQTPKRTLAPATVDVTDHSAWWIAWQAILSLVVGIGILVGLPWIADSPLIRWFKRRDIAAWLLIGLVWWVAGTFSGLGLVFCCGTIVHACRRSSGTPITDKSMTPGTVH